jgi:biotin carboxylase
MELARGYEIEAVAADQCDYSIFATAMLTHALGLPGPSVAAVQVGTNKKRLRLACQEHGIVQPEFRICSTPEELEVALDAIGLPCIMKPVDNRGAYGVRRIYGGEDLRELFYEGVAHAHSRELIVERLIEGTHVTIDGFAFGKDKHLSIAAASKEVLDGPRPIITEVVYPAVLPPDVLTHTFEHNDALVRALGINRGATHAEYVVDAAGTPYLLEIANRGGGVHTASKIIPAVTSVNISELLIRQALGENPEPPQGVGMHSSAILSFFIFPPGPLSRIEGPDEVQAMPGVLHLHLLVSSGQEIEKPRSAGERHGFMITVGTTAEEAREVARGARAALQPVYEDAR